MSVSELRPTQYQIYFSTAICYSIVNVIMTEFVNKIIANFEVLYGTTTYYIGSSIMQHYDTCYKPNL